MTADELLSSVHTLHFVGIGGSGMSPLAEILHTKGYRITGSDCNESDNLKRMRSLGIPVTLGQRAENIGPDVELVVYTAAVSPDNPELQEARRRGIPLLERAKLLGVMTRRCRTTVAVAGTHGKTTTTSMLAQILLEAGRDPSLFIGGRLPLIGANGRAGSHDLMVCEACEFKDHYLEMNPAIAVILNVDADHLDYFGSMENIIRSFHTFAGRTTGTVIYNADDAHAPQAVEGITNAKLVTYGSSDTCDWYARDIRTANGAYEAYDLYHAGQLFCHIQLGIPGLHNVQNSMAAAAAASLCGVSPDEIAAGIAHFHGAGRRFEFLGSARGVTVADDYAHHPTEITATLRTAKALPYKRVWAVFQPFTFSRTARHLDGFAQSLSIADEAVVSDIMGSREQNEWHVSSTDITSRMANGTYIPDFPAIADYIAAHAGEGDLVLTMGGGDVYKCARLLLERLAQ